MKRDENHENGRRDETHHVDRSIVVVLVHFHTHASILQVTFHHRYALSHAHVIVSLIIETSNDALVAVALESSILVVPSRLVVSLKMSTE